MILILLSLSLSPCAENKGEKRAWLSMLYLALLIYLSFSQHYYSKQYDT